MTLLSNKVTVILIIFMNIIVILSSQSVDGPALFHKNNRMEKLILSNQIGYHFKKVVREVSQELFIARKVDVSAIFLGITMLKQTQEALKKYCYELTLSVSESRPASAPKEGYFHISVPEHASFAEAKAKCKAKGMQLPEIYTMKQRDQLSAFLRDRKIAKVFAGIQPDIIDSMHRFISTGFPFWQTPHDRIINNNGDTVNAQHVIDDLNAEFFYTNKGDFLVEWENPSPLFVSGSYLGDSDFRRQAIDITQFMTPIVCEPKWNGSTIVPTMGKVPPGLRFTKKVKRAVSVNESTIPSASLIDAKRIADLSSLKEYCMSISVQAGDTQQEMFDKMKDLLSLVDISVQMDNSYLRPRGKRSPFIARYMFSNGARLIWNLYGLIQRMRMSARIGRLEDSLSETQTRVEDNSKAISNMSLTLYGHSIAIDQLKVTTADLDRRLNDMDRKLDYLHVSLHDLISKVETMVSLSLIESLILRIQRSLNTGYDTLKDIIHSSLLDQTSPLLLPLDQIKLVQAEVQKVSTAVLDTDFARMQSVVVTDPQDPHLLLVVINAAALGRRNSELIKLIPVPYFKNSKAFVPILDYDTILLDQLSRTYSVLSEQEETECLTSRCYVSDIEHSVNEKSCGIPQWFDQNMDICVFQETLSDGVFLRPMLPDGVLFAFEGEVTTQLFCKDNNAIGPIRKLNGTGTMQLPNGCILSVTDKQGRNTKVRGQPLYRMINAEDIDLTVNSPISMHRAIGSLNDTHRLMIHGTSVNDHLTSVVRQVETVDLQLKDQKLFIWILIGVVLAIVTLVLLIVGVAYRHRGKFYFKIFELRKRFTDIHQTLSEIEKKRRMGFTTYSSKPEFADTFSGHHLRNKSDGYVSERQSASYVTMNEVSAPPRRNDTIESKGFQSIKPVVKEEFRLGTYPSLTPLLDELSSNQLRMESKEVEKLCEARFQALRNNQ